LLNGREAVTFLCTPRALVEMVTGWLFAESLIESAGEIEVIGALCPELNRLYAQTQPDRWDDRLGLRTLLTTGCGAGGTWNSAATDFPPQQSSITVAAADLRRLLRAMLQRAEMHERTGGLHSAALASSDGIVASYEDVGRHNAVDKCVGRLLIDGLDASGLILLATGRISSDIVYKAARAGIPIVASLNSATSMALDIAETAGMTIVGKAGSNRPLIYTHARRIL
jgi:FdhD protein